MKHDRQKDSETQESRGAVQGIGFDADAQSQSVDQRMQGHSQKDADPAQIAPPSRRLSRVVVMLRRWALAAAARRQMRVFLRSMFVLAMHFCRTMVMKVKDAQEKKHDDQAGHHSIGGQIGAVVAQLDERVRQHMKHADSEHETADEADQDLHPGMR